MTRIEGVADGAGGPRVRAAYRVIRPAVGGRVPTSMRVTARRPALLWAMSVMEAVTTRRLRLSGRLLELATLKAASVVGCAFCLDIGSWVARTQHGVTEAELLALHRHRDAPCFDDADRAALDLAEAMTRDAEAAGEDDELWARLRAHFTDEELVELAHTVAWENYRARFNAAVGIGPDGFNAGSACAMRVPGAEAADAPAPPSVATPAAVPTEARTTGVASAGPAGAA